MTFENLAIIEPILRALKACGYEKPTPIQKQAIPILLRGKDLLGCAQTGTGKTAAFGVPILQLLHAQGKLDSRNKPIRALIVTPTRELAIQIGENLRDYGKYTDLRSTVIFGGVKQGTQVHALKKGIDILIATPGRLLDLIGQGYISLRHIQLFVLDEADRMLDMGFIHDIRKIIRELPKQRQSLFFSATMPPPIVKLSRDILGGETEKVSVTPQSSTAETVEQHIYFVDKKSKRNLLVHLLKQPDIDSALVFTRTKHGANRVAKVLSRAGINADAIHGNKSQNQRQSALQNFKAGRTRVLVATDIAARGIDVDELSHVINFDLPNVPETYVHRIGRTGRAGASGTALSFCDAEERAYLKDIQKLIDQAIPVVDEHPFPMENPMAAPALPASQPRTRGRGRGSNGRSSGNRRNSSGGDRRQSQNREGNSQTSNSPGSAGGRQQSNWRRRKPKSE